MPQGHVPFLFLFPCRSLGPQGDYGVFLCGQAGRDQPGDKGKEHADGDQRYGTYPGQIGAQGRDAGQGVQDDVDDQDQAQRDQNTDQAGDKSDGQRLCVEDAGDVALG